MNSEYSIAYSEVLIILKHMNKELVSKIPQKLLDFFYKEADSNHTLSLDYSIPLKEQKLNKSTLPLLAMLLINYWCNTQEEKEELINKYFENEQKYQEQLREKYNPDFLFNKNNAQ